MGMTKAEAGRLGAAAGRETRLRNADQNREKATADFTLLGKVCKECQTPIPFEKRDAEFCGRSCAASWNNRAFPKKPHRVRFCLGCQVKAPRDKRYCPSCTEKGLNRHQAQTLDQCETDASRRRLLLRTRPHQCESCKATEWQGQPIPLEMDHIDGDSGNNVEGNLRLICPNCHALSPFHKNRNKGRGRAKRRQRYVEGKSY